LEDDMSIQQRTARARKLAEQEKKEKLSQYLNSSSEAVSVDNTENAVEPEPAPAPASDAPLSPPRSSPRTGDSSLSSKRLSMAERAELAKLQAERETQLKLEQMKREKLEDFQKAVAASEFASSESPLGESGGSITPTGGSVAGRAELAKLRAEQETREKLEQMKQAKRQDYRKSVSGSGFSFSAAEATRQQEEEQKQLQLEKIRSAKLAEMSAAREQQQLQQQEGGGDGNEDVYMSPVQRKEAAKRRAEQEKQERLAGYFSTPTTSMHGGFGGEAGGEEGDGGGEGADSDRVAATTMMPTGSVKDRFERAKLQQQKAEEERLERLRNSASKVVHRSSTVAIKDVWSETLNNNSSSTKGGDDATGSADSRPTSFPHGGGLDRAKSKWATALEESKLSEEQRYNMTKKQTISQFRLTDGTGLVKKRIGEWEELFMELAASVEQLESTLAAARLLSEKHTLDAGELYRLQKEFRENANVPIEFEMGCTKIFNAKLMDHQVASYIKRTLQENATKHVALSCGVYGDQEGGKPPIDVFAAAIRTDDKTMYIALTIKPTPGCELDARAYGIKKVAVFSKDQSKLLERVVDVIPAKGWEQWVAQGSYGVDDPTAAGGPLSPEAHRKVNGADPGASNVDGESVQEASGVDDGGGVPIGATASAAADAEASAEFVASKGNELGPDSEAVAESALNADRQIIRTVSTEDNVEDNTAGFESRSSVGGEGGEGEEGETEGGKFDNNTSRNEEDEGEDDVGEDTWKNLNTPAAKLVEQQGTSILRIYVLRYFLIFVGFLL
jgi:hypothetical protein